MKNSAEFMDTWCNQRLFGELRKKIVVLFERGLRGATPRLDDGAWHFRCQAFIGGSGDGAAGGELLGAADSMFRGRIAGVVLECRGGAVLRGRERGFGGVLAFEN